MADTEAPERKKRNNGRGKKVMLSKDGNPICIYTNIAEASKHLGMYFRLVQKHCTSGDPYKGYTFCQVGSWIPDVPRMPEDADKVVIPFSKPDVKYYDRDTITDREKYRILKYEVRYTRVCITPCPFKDAPKPNIGSAQCLGCTHNRGRNKQAREVACAFSPRYKY